VIKVPDNDALHAYKPLLPAVKTGQPHDLWTQRYGNLSEYAKRRMTLTVSFDFDARLHIILAIKKGCPHDNPFSLVNLKSNTMKNTVQRYEFSCYKTWLFDVF